MMTNRQQEVLINDQTVESVARHLAAACLSYQLGISFESAMRCYVKQRRIGELWKTAAHFILNHQTDRSSPKPSIEGHC